MTHVKTKDAAVHIEGPDASGHYWLHLSASGETCRIDLGRPRGMVETALLMAASVKFGRPGGDYTLAPHLQKIVDGAKTAPQWDTQADRLAALPARGVPTDCRKWGYYPIEMPLTKGGHGPAIPGRDEIACITYEVWDRTLGTHASFDNLPDAINEAMRLSLVALAPTDAPHVNETPKSEHDGADVLTDAAQAREAALREAHKAILAMDTKKDEDLTYNLAVLRAAEKVRRLIGEART